MHLQLIKPVHVKQPDTVIFTESAAGMKIRFSGRLMLRKDNHIGFPDLITVQRKTPFAGIFFCIRNHPAESKVIIKPSDDLLRIRSAAVQKDTLSLHLRKRCSESAQNVFLLTLPYCHTVPSRCLLHRCNNGILCGPAVP